MRVVLKGVVGGDNLWSNLTKIGMRPLEVKWTDLQPAIHPVVQQAITEGLGFETVMPVQKAVVPLIAKNYDVAVESCTGSGKTLAFLIPIFDFLIKAHIGKAPGSGKVTIPEKHLKAVVISPTRELAAQTAQVAQSLADHIERTCGLRFPILLLSGGGITKSSGENDAKPVLAIATPGRLREILVSHADLELSTSDLDFLILDEADRLIEGNHRFDVRDILSKLPKQRRTGLFSATLNNVKIEELMNLGLRNPAKVKLKSKPTETSSENTESNAKLEKNFSTPEQLNNAFISFQNRFEKLVYVYRKLPSLALQKSIIFFNTCDSVDFYFKLFRNIFPDLKIYELHGKLEQKKRDKVFALFAAESAALLIATDVVARGIDFENVQNIIQFDAPQQPENFVHRIGRTARGASAGNAFYLAGPNELSFLHYLTEKGVMFALKKKFTADQHSDEAEAVFKRAMLTDRDFFVKAKRAFVSFLRSYKEHVLKTVFDLSQIDIYDVTRSFLLPIVPKTKEITTDPAKRVLDEEYLKQLEMCEFADPNQAKQFKDKEADLLKKRAQMEEERRQLQLKAKREQSQKKHRSLSERNRSKQNQKEIEESELAYEATLLKKLRRGVISQEEFDRKIDRLDAKAMGDLDD